MNKPNTNRPLASKPAISQRTACLSAAAADAIRDIYQRLDAVIAGHQPRCDASGRCCHFDAYGHRLYVTTLEMMYFADAMGLAPLPPTPRSEGNFSLPQLPHQPGCPWQMDGLCTARDARPLGCRIYFCDPANQHWQPETYEAFHREITGLHDRFDTPYQYTEWRAALAGYVKMETT